MFGSSSKEGITQLYSFGRHWFLSQSATVRGSNRTQVPMWNEGMRPAFACLKIVT